MNDNKKNIKFCTLFICSLLMIGVSSCEDFLTEKPVGSVNETTLANEEGVNALLIGTYAIIDGYAQGTSPSGSLGGASVTNWIYGDVASDDMHRGDKTGGWAPITDIERFEARTDNGWLNECWGVNYEGISRANDVIRILGMANDIDEETGAKLKAEALFLRAWFHFQLRLKFEKIPFVTEDVDPITVKNDIEVWDLIENDLKTAIPSLDTDPSQLGRASKWAAKTLLARVHMFQKEWTEAKTYLDDVLNNGPFTLEDHFYNNFDEEKQNNDESIFEIQYSVNDGAGQHNSGIDHQVSYPVGPDVSLCCSYSAPSFDLFNAFKVDDDGLPMLDTFRDELLTEDHGILDVENFTPTNQLMDPRVDWTIGRRGVPFLDWGAMSGSDWMSDQVNMGPFMNKKIMWYKRNKGVISTTSRYWAPGVNGNNFRVLRLGHVILWRAEVAAELNELPLAMSLVNQIRERASDDILMGRVLNTSFGSDDVEEIDYSQPAAEYKLGLYTSFPDQAFALKAVRFETRLEFALEGMRFFDLVRWGIDQQTMQSYINSETSNGKIPWLSGATYVEGKNDHWPLPQIQLDLQPDVLTQDPNY